MSGELTTLVSGLRQQNAIDEQGVLALRREIFRDGTVDIDEAEAILTLNRKVRDKHDSFYSLLIDVVQDHITGGSETGCETITEGEAAWLERVLAPSGVIETPVELEALIRIMEQSQDVPERLAGFALSQVKHGILMGEGPTTRGRMKAGQHVDAADVEMLRRMLYAVGSKAGIAVTRDEADILFDIHDATVCADNDPSFEDLFVKAIANHVLAYSGFRVGSRREALAVNSVSPESRGVMRVFSEMTSSMVRSDFGGGLAGMREMMISPELAVDAAFEDRRKEDELAGQIASAVTPDEAAWLTTRIMRDGRPTAAEQALLTFIIAGSPNSDPALKRLVATAS